jgi:hypothetical protein
MSDVNGNYTKILVAYYNYTLALIPPAGSGLSTTLINNIDLTTDVQRDLVIQSGYTLSGTVKTPSGMLSANVIIRVYDQNSSTPAGEVVSDSQGYYTISLTPGIYKIGIEGNIPSKFICRYVESNLSITRNTTHDIIVPIKTITGKIKDSKGNAVSGVSVGVADNQWYYGPDFIFLYNPEIPAMSDVNGNYTKVLVAYYNYTLALIPPASSGLSTTLINNIDLTTDVQRDLVIQSGYLLAIAKDGSGGGTVSSDIGAIFCGAVCSDHYPYGDTVLLYATPSPTSLFTGWSGCPGIGTCTVSITGAKNVTATFTAAPKVKIGAVTYQNLQAAYDIAPDYAVIRMLDGVDAGPLTANRSATVTLSGGYNTAYTAQNGSTDLLGKVTIQKGTVIFDRVIVR